MNRGGLGARSLNIELQNALNPPGDIRIDRFGWTFCPGDKVMQVENDYDKDVYNGDLGVVSRIDMEEGELHVDFDGREITYSFGELDELVLAYATTIHKSQAKLELTFDRIEVARVQSAVGELDQLLPSMLNRTFGII
jgi:exodeoxyribonuclease V alpha subunit